MAEKKQVTSGSFSADWLFRGALTRIGDTVDKFTGRRWIPSSSLATSELIERVKRLLDSEAKTISGKGTVVPHNIKLKVQWDKFSTDSDETLRKLEFELLTAAADHINDNLYYTNEPLRVEVKPDYFTEGVRLFVSFDRFIDDEHEAQLNVTIPSIQKSEILQVSDTSPTAQTVFIARFELKGSRRDRRFEFSGGGRLSVGRTAANDLAIDDTSISKIHASIVIAREGQISVADTGSTNGTFINGERIPYGKAMTIGDSDVVRFGTVDVTFERIEETMQSETEPSSQSQENTIRIDDMEFSSGRVQSAPGDDPPEKTLEIDPSGEARAIDR